MNSDEFLEKISICYSFFDRNFMAGMIKIVNGLYKNMIDNGLIKSDDDLYNIFNEYDGIIERDNGVSIDESLELSLQFFEALHPMYKSMAMNILNQSIIRKGNSQNSRAYSIQFSGNQIDSSIICHEIAHSFVISKNQLNKYNNLDYNQTSPIFTILSEINSYIVQLLYYDFLLEKNKNSFIPADILTAIMVIVDLKRKEKFLNKDDEMFKVLCSNLVLNQSKDVFEYFRLDSSSKELDAMQVFEQNIQFLSHIFGITIACFIYQKIIENRDNIKMFLGIEKAQGILGEEEVTLRTLEALEIPCFKNGKIILDDATVDLLVENLFKTFNMLNEIKKPREHVSFCNGQIINDDNIDEVNYVFNKLESKRVIL